MSDSAGVRQIKWTAARLSKVVRFLAGELKREPRILKKAKEAYEVRVVRTVGDGRALELGSREPPAGGEMVWRRVVAREDVEDVVRAADKDPHTMGGRDRLYSHLSQKYIGISRRAIAEVLARLESHQLHQPVAKAVQHRAIVASDVGRAQIDLIDMTSVAQPNNGYAWILTYVDLFSKWVAARPMKTKSARHVEKAIDDIMEGLPEDKRPTVVQTDNGSEFSTWFENHMREAWGAKVVHSAAYKPSTNGAVERVNRDLKSTLFRHMTQHSSQRWVDVLQAVVDNHNNARHSTTKHTPAEVMKDASLRAEVHENIKGAAAARMPALDKREAALKVGDKVRVALSTQARVRKNAEFASRLKQNWSDQLYTIRSISKPSEMYQRKQYLLTKASGRELKKRFFASQLQKVDEARLIKDVGSVADRPVYVAAMPDPERLVRVDLPSRPVVPSRVVLPPTALEERAKAKPRERRVPARLKD